MKIKIFISALLIGLIVFLLLGNKGVNSLGSGANHSTIKCTTSTVAAAPVGHQVSSTVLAAHSNRAYARIERVVNTLGTATNTPSIAFNDGTAATLTSGLTLSTSTPYIEFGLDTDFPYVGAVTGITETGSTTVRVTECRY